MTARGAWALRPYSAVAATALKQALRERGPLLGRIFFYAAILVIFSRLWQVVSDRGALTGLGTSELVWYVAITEWIVLSVPLLHLDIEADVRSGDIAYSLSRPVSYLGSKLAAATGEYLLRATVLALCGAALAWILGGGLPADPGGLVEVLPVGLLAAGVVLLFHAAIGVSAVWLQDASPVYWIWQKLVFVLGGLLLPLEIYPGWLLRIAAYTPFPAMLYGPGRLAFGTDLALAASVALRLLIWGGVAAALLAMLYRRALRALDVNGG